MKNIFIWVVILMTNTVLYAQTIKGKIIDPQTKESIPGVNIYLPEIQKGVVSNANGDFEINLPRKGKYKIQISFIGYDIILREVEVNEVAVVLNLELEEAVIETQEFVVSSVYQSSQDENPIEVIQFDSKELQRSSDVSMMQSLSKVPGVDVVGTGSGIGKPVIRGLSGNRVLVYSQGMPVDNQQWGDDHGLGLSELGIDKVEVIKGPSSLLYGADAMGGVLHFVSEKPAVVNTIVGGYGVKYFTNTEGVKTDVGIKGSSESFRFGINAGYNTHADYKQSEDIRNRRYTRVTNTRFNERSLKSRIGFLTKPWTVDFGYTFHQAVIGIPEDQFFQNLDKQVMIPYQLNTSHIISMENSFYLGESKLKVNLGYQLNDRKEFEHEHHEEEDEDHIELLEVDYLDQQLIYSLNDTGALDMSLETINYDVKWFLPIFGKWEIIVGSQGKQQTNSNKGEEVLIPNASVSQYGIFSLVKYNLDKLHVMSGLRYDVKGISTEEVHIEHEDGDHQEIESISTSFSSVNGSLGLTYELDSAWVLRTNLATGFRAPNLAELTSNGVHHGSLRYELGNAMLKTENNIELDLGTEIGTEHVSFTVSGFYNSIHNYIYLLPQDSVVESFQLFEYQQTDAVIYGFEAGIDIHPHAMHWLHFETQFAALIGKKSDGTDLPRIPANNLLNTLKAEFDGKGFLKRPFISLSANTVFAQNNTGLFEGTTDAYMLFNANIGADIKLGKQKLELSFGVTNLLDQQYYHHLSRLKPRGISNMGRNVVMNLRIPFNIKSNS